MIRTALRLAVALAVPLTLVAAPAAHAGICVESNTFNYSPPLGLTATSGTMSSTYIHHECVFQTPGSGSNSPIGYTGNCLVAIFGANTVSVVVLGGTVHVMVDVAARKSKVMPMVPDGICPTSRATGTGLWIDA